MLTELHVTNLGILDDLTVALGPGLTAITGETGAGKTLLVEALSLLLGGRAESALVRDGAIEARVEGRFVHGDDECVLVRVVPVGGRSRAYIDGNLATIGELAETGRRLVDLHGQHDQQSLLDPSQQRAMVDAFVGAAISAPLGALHSARQDLRALRNELDSLGGDDRARARELDLLGFQLDEIDAAGLVDPDEDDRLIREESLLADADAHRDAVERAHDLLGDVAADALGEAMASLAQRPPFQRYFDRVHSLQAEVTEVASELRVERDGIVVDPARLDQVRQRRLLLRELRRKYGVDLGEVLRYRDEIRARADALAGHDLRAAEIEAAQLVAAAAVRGATAELNRFRAAAAPLLAEAVTVGLHELALPSARFDIEVQCPSLATEPPESAIAAAEGVGDAGIDQVTFVLAPNPGEPARPLAKAASGGELSRTMLAIRVVLSEAPPTLVFDEVDAGIGGEAGIAVGRALRGLGRQHQVLCVTHLPQVAAFAHGQISVAKRERAGRTVADASLLLPDARVGELSRMLSGLGASAHAREHAQELLDLGPTADAAPSTRGSARTKPPAKSGTKAPAKSRRARTV